MNILVTGAAGFTGRALVKALRRQEPGAKIVGLGPRPAAPPLPPQVQWVTGTASDSAIVAQAIRKYEISHVAHLARGARAGNDEEVIGSHVGLLLGLLRGVADSGTKARVLALGSAAEYGLVPASQLPLREDRPLNPASVYGMAKVAETTLALLAPEALGVDVTVARIFNPIGEGQGPSFVCGKLAAHFAAAKYWGAKRPLEMGSLSPMRDFIDVRDVAEALVGLLQKGLRGEVYNVGSGVGTTISEILEHFREISGLDISAPAESIPDRDASIHSVASISKIQALTGWNHRIAIRDSIDSMYRFALAPNA